MNNNGGNEFNHLNSSFNPVPVVEDVNNNYYSWYVPPHENNLTFSPTQPQFFFQLNPTNPDNTLDQNFTTETGFLAINTATDCQPDTGVANLISDPTFATTQFANGYGPPDFLGLAPLQNLGSAGEQPILFQRGKNSSEANAIGGENLDVLNDVDDISFDASGMIYDSDDFTKIKFQVNGDGETSNANNTVRGRHGGYRKGKKRGLPAKNLSAERRRRVKLNDKLLVLRSVVPRISKMDRASILGDAIEYLKELLQNINALNLELESIPSSSSLLGPAAATEFYQQLTPTATTIPPSPCIKFKDSVVLSRTGQPPRIEVTQTDGGKVNIHMFCGRRPGLLLSIAKTLDSLGLDAKQATISCFNGFTLDIFRAEKYNEVQELHPDQIKALLLESVGSHGVA